MQRRFSNDPLRRTRDRDIKCMFFYVFQGEKIKLVDKMKQSTYLYVSLHVKHKKIPIISIL